MPAAFKWRRKEKPQSERNTAEPSPCNGGGEMGAGRCEIPRRSGDADVEHATSLEDKAAATADQSGEVQDAFDPEKHYAQVLEEAKIHLNISTQTILEQTSWLQDASSYQLCAYKRLQNKLRHSNSKPSRPLRYFLFWKRPILNYRECVSFSNAKPQQSTFLRQSGACYITKKAGHGYSANLDFMDNSVNTKQSKLSSGPLYTDGLPSQPCNIRKMRKSHSGPVMTLSGGKDSINISPYAPLHCRLPQSPLYYCY